MNKKELENNQTTTNPEEIVITQTQEEYFLKIPAWQKDRAKGIEGYRWNPERKRWVYPRTRRTYNALVSEFWDDLSPSYNFSRPMPRKPEDNGFEKDIALYDTIKEYEKTIAKQKREIQGLMEQVEDLEEKVVSNSTESSVTIDRYEVIKEVALECLGNDPVFVDEVRKLTINHDLPGNIVKVFENHLKQVFQPDKAKSNFFNLIDIYQYSDEAPDEDDISMLHLIRKQRNISMHEDSQDDRTRMARAIFCLFGAVWLLPRLPEIARS